MGDVLLAGTLLFGVPFAIFVWVNWRREQRERELRRGPDATHKPPDKHLRSHWGGLGRPGR